MPGANDLSKMVPGFEFLQGLVTRAGASLPTMGQWVAPTLDPEDIKKRIDELRTVQFWLEQNARLLGTTIQALEVQRMTLSTLQSMNLPMAELRDSLRATVPELAPEPRATKTAATAPAVALSAAPAAALAAAPAVDPLQWWGALTKQFSELAAQAVKDGASATAKPSAAPKAEAEAEAKGKKAAKAGSATRRRAPRKTAR